MEKESVGFLIDTCIWIDVERGTLSPADVETFTKDSPVFLSPVTIAELTYGAEMVREDAVKTRRLAALSRLKEKPLLPMDGLTGEIFGRLAAVLLSRGKQTRHRVQDLWLASQAIQYGFTLLTRNVKDFKDIPGLDLVSVRD